MGVYSPEVEDKLLNSPMADNPLFKYDNYTYHIQFFIVDNKSLDEYLNIRFSPFFNGVEIEGDDGTEQLDPGIDTSTQAAADAYEVIKDKKVIIAESGVTSDVSIEELIIKTVPAFGDNKTYTASEEFQMRLFELGSNDLVNKMHLAATILGYESYINTPYFISISFSGYDNTNKGKPTSVISEVFNGPSEFVYCVIAEKVDVTSQDSGASYRMTLRPLTDVGMAPEYVYMKNLTFETWDPTTSFSEIVYKLLEKKNQEIYEMNEAVYQKLYKGEWVLDYQITTKEEDPQFYENVIKKSGYQLSEMEKQLAFLNILDILEDRAFNPKPKEARTYMSSDSQLMDRETHQALLKYKEKNKDIWDELVKKYKSRSIDKYNDIYSKPGFFKKYRERLREALLKDMKREDPNSPEYYWPGGTYKPVAASNLCSMITEIWQICSPKSDLMPSYTFVPTRVGDFAGRTYYKLVLNISFVKIPGLAEMKEAIENGGLYYEDGELPAKQLEYIDECLARYAVLKRYHYLLNGQDTSVLEYQTSEDNFWYLNVGTYAVGKAREQIPYVEETDVELQEEETKRKTLYLQMVADMVNNKMSLLKKKNGYQNVSLNDLVSMVTDDATTEIKMAFYRAAEANDVLIRLQEILHKNETDKTSIEMYEGSEGEDEEFSKLQIAKIAAENMLSHNQKNIIKLRILGDPYWLSLSTEFYKILGVAWPHIIMCTKSYTKLNGTDDYVENKRMELNTIYAITSITSTFQEGKFTQELSGYVPPPFVGEYIPKAQKEEEDKQKGGVETAWGQCVPTYVEAKTGRVYIEHPAGGTHETGRYISDPVRQQSVPEVAKNKIYLDEINPNGMIEDDVTQTCMQVLPFDNFGK